MLETRTVLECHTCGAFWDPDAEDAACLDSTHDHRSRESHLHRTPVVFPDNTTVTAVSFGSADPYARRVAPDFGLYLDERWAPPWPHELLDWPDFSVPDDPAVVVAALGALRERARSGEQVEIGCYGGHGRTGTALACLAVICGLPPKDAAAWVQSAYCDRAVETDDQEAFVRALVI